MSKSTSFQKDAFSFASKDNRQNSPLRKDQTIMYEGEKGKVISVKPLLVIRTENRVICGDLKDQLEYTNE